MLTLANPTTVLSFIAIFAAINISAASGDYSAAGILVLGVFIGAAIWWLCLALGVGVIRHRVDEPVLRWIARASAGLVIAFGIYTLWRGIAHIAGLRGRAGFGCSQKPVLLGSAPFQPQSFTEGPFTRIRHHVIGSRRRPAYRHACPHSGQR